MMAECSDAAFSLSFFLSDQSLSIVFQRLFNNSEQSHSSIRVRAHFTPDLQIKSEVSGRDRA